MKKKTSSNFSSSIALTDRCINIREFMLLLADGNGSTSLSNHLKKCQTCRKVAADAVKALISEGVPFEVNPGLKKLAAKLIDQDDGDEEIALAVAATKDAPPVKLSPSVRSYEVQLSVELAEGGFLLRANAKNAEGAIATLKNPGGQLCAPPRRIDSGLWWPALAAGTYRLKISGKEGCVTFRIALSGA